jgi:hypothetical protein
MADDEDREWLENYLPRYRDELLRSGMSKEDVDWAVSLAWTGVQTPTITTLDQYKAACALHDKMAETVPKRDYKSPEAVRLAALGGEMIRFEEEYQEQHGRLPPISSSEGEGDGTDNR